MKGDRRIWQQPACNPPQDLFIRKQLTCHLYRFLFRITTLVMSEAERVCQERLLRWYLRIKKILELSLQQNENRILLPQFFKTNTKTFPKLIKLLAKRYFEMESDFWNSNFVKLNFFILFIIFKNSCCNLDDHHHITREKNINTVPSNIEKAVHFISRSLPNSPRTLPKVIHQRTDLVQQGFENCPSSSFLVLQAE